MNTSTQTPAYSPEELDDAAVWIARLRAPDRSAHIENGFRRWLDEKPSHTAAYDAMSAAWDLTGGLKRRPFPKVSRWERAGFRAGFLKAGASLVAIAAIAVVGGVFYQRASGVSTGVGEQRVLNLPDGTRVTLNTSSRVVVRYDDRTRRVELKEGEALFDVNKDPLRPFIVSAHGRQIRALGTSFLVRGDGDQLAVTLLEGKIEVTELGAADVAPVTLTPGQRLVLRSRESPKVDAPQLEQITGWRRGWLEFDDAPLADAVAEVNRYSALKLELRRDDVSGIRINGVFRTGDVSGFAAGVSRSYGFTTTEQDGKLVLR